MKAFSALSAAFLFAVALQAQNTLDTLIIHTFEGETDPTDTMLTEPNGDDLHWVNYDQDNKTPDCVTPGPTPKGWYWESDLGVPFPWVSDNDAFTSCSYLSNSTVRNRNWLITPPIFIPSENYWLSWRSLSYYGPDLMDGYKVLASRTTNFPAGFKDTLFRVASRESAIVPFSLELDDYVFSPGYIHANGYTDTTYFFVDFENNAPFYHGKLEPHSVSLADFSGQTIYLAFLHDARLCFHLQIDDILVSRKLVSVQNPDIFLDFGLSPNPASDVVFVNWTTRVPESGRVTVLDLEGRVVQRQEFGTCSECQVHFSTEGWAAGVYRCRVETANGQAAKALVKI